MSDTVTPFVYWAQDERNIYLKLELNDPQDIKVVVTTDYLGFSCMINGEQGKVKHRFHLDFYDKVNKSGKHYKVSDGILSFEIPKLKSEWWPRLIIRPDEAQWLKIDIDRWVTPRDKPTADKLGDIYKVHPHVLKNLQKEEFGYVKEDAIQVYLKFYNFFMFLGFFYVWLVIHLKYIFIDGDDFLPKVFETVWIPMYIMQTLQLMEIIHNVMHITKGNTMMSFFQITGRIFVLFLMIGKEPRVQTSKVIYMLFVVWTSIEIIRYPYYLCRLFKEQCYPIEWLRYNAWIVLYPTGMICEAVINYKNLVYMIESRKWSIDMPNLLNFTFSSPDFLRVYLMLFTVPVSFALLRHMYLNRKKKVLEYSKKKAE